MSNSVEPLGVSESFRYRYLSGILPLTKLLNWVARIAYDGPSGRNVFNVAIKLYLDVLRLGGEELRVTKARQHSMSREKAREHTFSPPITGMRKVSPYCWHHSSSASPVEMP